jgi:hypothetical protein
MDHLAKSFRLMEDSLGPSGSYLGGQGVEVPIAGWLQMLEPDKSRMRQGDCLKH